MLSATGLLAMLAGVFIAGAGAFGWEFLLSDGRYDYGWVASLGRSGARSLLSVVGVGLLLFGFVARVLGVADQPLPPEAVAESAPLAGSPESVGPAKRPATSGPATNKPGTEQPAPESDSARAPTTAAGSSATNRHAIVGTPSASVTTSEGPPPSQLVTLWNPVTELEGEAGTFVTIQYRFEHGVQPQSGETYVWAIELPGGTKELVYEGESLREQGELRRLVEVNLVDVPVEWRTWLTREQPAPALRVSNRLTMVPRRAIRSDPP